MILRFKSFFFIIFPLQCSSLLDEKAQYYFNLLHSFLSASLVLPHQKKMWSQHNFRPSDFFRLFSSFQRSSVFFEVSLEGYPKKDSSWMSYFHENTIYFHLPCESIASDSDWKSAFDLCETDFAMKSFSLFVLLFSKDLRMINQHFTPWSKFFTKVNQKELESTEELLDFFWRRHLFFCLDERRKVQKFVISGIVQEENDKIKSLIELYFSEKTKQMNSFEQVILKLLTLYDYIAFQDLIDHLENPRFSFFKSFFDFVESVSQNPSD